MNLLKKHYKLIVLVLIIAYVISIVISQQKMLNSYNAEIKTLEKQIARQEETKESLDVIKDNIDSTEYIEQIAREKLGMYLPNERVYIDIGM